jgi:Uri superfamily endonuclease
VILKIARTHADRQRFALAQARAGRDPLRPPPSDVEPPFDTLGPGEVLNRLGRNVGALNKVADGLRDLPLSRWPKPEEVACVLAAAEVIARQARQMKRMVEDSKTRATSGKAKRRTGGERAGQTRKPFDPRFARRDVAAVGGVTAKNFRDLPRALSDTPPTEVQRESLLARLGALEAATVRLSAAIRWGGHDTTTGPSGVPGTYVVFFRLTRPKKRLTIGALGTFDFPAGTYAYLGSAFGAGGVRNRTGRHLTPGTKKKWNIDWLKPHCTPLAVWWTHDRRKVEFGWASILGALPGAGCPVKGFGAADNPDGNTHLVRFDELPSLAGFRRRARRYMPDHAGVHGVEIENWAGTGWPALPTGWCPTAATGVGRGASDPNDPTSLSSTPQAEWTSRGFPESDASESPDGTPAEQAGVEAGEWWAERKASGRELSRLANWVAELDLHAIDPFEPDHLMTQPYAPHELVYFALSPKREHGDRSAAKWFWEPLPGWEKSGKHDPKGQFVRGFVRGAVGGFPG